MAPLVNKPGHPPDVIALIATKETDVTVVLNVSKEIVARNVPLVSKVTNVNNALRDSKEMNVNSVRVVTMEMIVVMF